MPEFSGVIERPGLYPDVPEGAYHGDPVSDGSLSVSGAKMLLPPSCPALFDHARKHGKHSKSMDTGTRVHALVLGKDADHLQVLDFRDYKTKAAQEAKRAAIAAGKVPTLPHEMAEAQAIAGMVLADPAASRLLATVTDCELSGFWFNAEHGIWLRMRLDALGWGDRPEIVDVKTTRDASPDGFARSIAEYRYDMQDHHYREGLAAILSGYPGEVSARDIGFTFIAVQTTEPYLVMVYELDAAEHERAEESNRIARATYAACTARGEWPKWSDTPVTLSLPYYRAKQIEREINDYYS